MFTVENSGMAYGDARTFVCDDEGNVIVEVFGGTEEEARLRAKIIAEALNEHESK